MTRRVRLILDMEPEKKAYEVGYQRPPLATQFQPGKSGNPNGRPKNSLNALTEIKRVMNTKIEVKTGAGVTKKMRKGTVILERMALSALSGKHQPAAFLMNHSLKASAAATSREAAPVVEAYPFTPDDETVRAGILARLKAQITETESQHHEPISTEEEPGVRRRPRIRLE